MEWDSANLHWYWLAAGVLLIAAEAFIPGAVLLWFGVSALLTGVVSLTSDWSMNSQLIFFSVVAVSCTVAFKMWQKANPPPSPDDDAASHLNQAGQDLLGRKLKLVTDLRDGNGRVKVADSSWRCTGPDLDEGSTVVVVKVHAGTLTVEPVDQA
ncbi:MAG: NfeD family protein [Oceanococcus sp.]